MDGANPPGTGSVVGTADSTGSKVGPNPAVIALIAGAAVSAIVLLASLATITVGGLVAGKVIHMSNKARIIVATALIVAGSAGAAVSTGGIAGTGAGLVLKARNREQEIGNSEVTTTEVGEVFGERIEVSAVVSDVQSQVGQ